MRWKLLVVIMSAALIGIANAVGNNTPAAPQNLTTIEVSCNANKKLWYSEVPMVKLVPKSKQLIVEVGSEQQLSQQLTPKPEPFIQPEQNLKLDLNANHFVALNIDAMKVFDIQIIAELDPIAVKGFQAAYLVLIQ